MKEITTKELDSIRFYQGDVRKRKEDGSLSDELQEGFWGQCSAYKTMNCLMFPGIGNEMERIREKKAALIPQLLTEVDKIVEVYCDTFRAMCKCRDNSHETMYRKAYRTERGISVEELKKGYTVSFTSTSKSSTPEEFLKGKSGLTLLEILIPANVPQLDFEEIFCDTNLFPQQREILLPPFLKIQMKELSLSETENAYRDTDGNPPKGKYLVEIADEMDFAKMAKEDSLGIQMTEAENKEAAEFLEKLTQGMDTSEEEARKYCGWKAAFRNKIKAEFSRILAELSSPEESTMNKNGLTISEQRKQLISDVDEMCVQFKNKQTEYKRLLDKGDCLLSIANAMVIGGISLSFVPVIGDLMKILAILGGILSIVITQQMKTRAYGVKAMQRSKTFLRLCDLRLEIRYTQHWTPEVLQSFTEKFLNIMRSDTEMSLQNLQMQIESSEENYRSEEDLKRIN